MTHDLFERPGTVLLDTARLDQENRKSLLFVDPVRVLEAYELREVQPLLDEIDEAVSAGYFVAGYLAYGAGYAFERFAPKPSGERLGWFGIYEAPSYLRPEEVEGLLERAGRTGFTVTAPTFSPSREAYRARIARIREHIREGDVYQINYTGTIDLGFEGSAGALYGALRARQRVAYGAYLHTGENRILSFSPELFFRREGNRVIARPMKGTVHRGRDWMEDERLRRWLESDPKSRAENLMIVDLVRNDLSRCCLPGSVRVPELFTTERYPTLIQMTSTVVGNLEGAVAYAGLFRALFPCGSITGAPKIRAMQIIQELEGRPRGVYCGAIGYMAPDSEAVFNVAIRTVVLRDGRGEMGAGSGIVWDSDADAEYDECQLKADFLTSMPSARESAAPESDFSLIETMQWDGSIRLLEYHLVRMGLSAAHFGLPFDEWELRGVLAREVEALDPDTRYRVRVTLDSGGRFAVTSAPLEPLVDGVKTVMIADQRVDSGDELRRHKTTLRAMYKESYRAAVARGCYEVLFLNERGEVTEGSRTNVFLRRGDEWFTPPVASGLLPGVYRQYLLETLPSVSERVLFPDDLRTADGVYVCNAVRGLVEVNLARVPSEA